MYYADRMPYRIVILNGTRRGERVDVNASPLTIGSNISCTLQLGDPHISPVHAQVIPEGDTLCMRVLNDTDRIRINGTEVREAHLKHGDVAEIGETHFFVQAHDTSTWGNITDLRRTRTWLTVGLPIALLLIIAVAMNRHRQPAPEKDETRAAPTATEKKPAPVTAADDDSSVTNAPRIAISTNISLSAKVPEVEAAKRFLATLKTNTVARETETTRAELDLAARFLQEAGGQDMARTSATNLTEESSLIQARAVLADSGVSSNPPVASTNGITGMDTNNPSSNTNAPSTPP